MATAKKVEKMEEVKETPVEKTAVVFIPLEQGERAGTTIDLMVNEEKLTLEKGKSHELPMRFVECLMHSYVAPSKYLLNE